MLVSFPCNSTTNNKEELKMTNVVIYTKDHCPFCVKAKNLLTMKNIPYKEIDLTHDDEGRIALVSKANGLKTVPQIFVGEYHIGGCDNLYELNDQGKLEQIMQDHGNV